MSISVDRISPINSELCLAIDPGNTTGIALMQWPNLRGTAQYKGGITFTASKIRELIEKFKPETVIVEDYRVYPWKQKQHVWSPLNTVRLIGAIQLVCSDLEVRYVLQGAHKAKIISDSRLKEWGVYKVRKPHANDAIRHILSYILFGESKSARSTRHR